MSAELEGVFNPIDHSPTMGGGGKSLPASDKNGHLVVITESEIRQTSDGTGQLLAFTLQILDGVNAGTEGEWRLNIGNANELTVKIAMNELSCICHAVGHFSALQSVEPLHNKQFRVVVELQKDPEAAAKGWTNVTKVLRADGSKLTDPAGGAASASVAPAPAVAPGSFANAPEAVPNTVQAAAPATVPAAPQPTAPAPAIPPAAPVAEAPAVAPAIAPVAPAVPPTAPAATPQAGWPAPVAAAPTAPPAQPAAPAPDAAMPWNQAPTPPPNDEVPF